MNEEDRETFPSFVMAQLTVTNTVYKRLGCPTFYFCPTGVNCLSGDSSDDFRILRDSGHSYTQRLRVPQRSGREAARRDTCHVDRWSKVR